nr:N-acetylmuramoyl-L-alanine amidase [Paucisalibacillus globulus]
MKLYLDPGHGGTDPGAQGNGLVEKVLTLAIALKIRDLLKDYNLDVRMSRTTDKTVTLPQRTDDANKWGADYFLSIHINAFNGKANGYEDFIHDKLSNTSETAKIRNVMHAEIIKLVDFNNRGKKKANFHVIRESKMPAMLTENGFIDNKEDAAKLKQDSYLNKIAQGHANGIVKAFNLKKKSTPVKDTPKSSGNVHTVVKGDTLWSISQKYNTTVSKLKQLNGLKDDLIHPGDKIKLPGASKPVYYTIEKGDTFWGIEKKKKIKHGTLQELNPNVNPKWLKIGQKIRIK